MPEYKNQHYVPRAHFKPFSLGGSGKAINIHLVQKDRAVWGGTHQRTMRQILLLRRGRAARETLGAIGRGLWKSRGKAGR